LSPEKVANERVTCNLAVKLQALEASLLSNLDTFSFSPLHLGVWFEGRFLLPHFKPNQPFFDYTSFSGYELCVSINNILALQTFHNQLIQELVSLQAHFSTHSYFKIFYNDTTSSFVEVHRALNTLQKVTNGSGELVRQSLDLYARGNERFYHHWLFLPKLCNMFPEQKSCNDSSMMTVSYKAHKDFLDTPSRNNYVQEREKKRKNREENFSNAIVNDGVYNKRTRYNTDH